MFFSDDSTPTEPPTKSKIYGIIKDSKTESVINGALVTLNPGGKSMITANDGSYSFDELNADKYTFTITKNGYQNGTGSVIIELDQTVSKDFTIVPLAKIYGTVKDKINSQPIADVKVLLTETGESKNTNNEGVYRFENLEGGKEYTLTAAKATYSTNTEAVSIANGEEKEVNFNLNPLKPILEISPLEFVFANAEFEKNLTLSNIGVGNLNYSIETDASWIIPSQISGIIATEIKNIMIKINREGLPYGIYNKKITINSNGGNKEIPVIIYNQDPNVPTFSLSTHNLNFGETETTKTLTITNTGMGELNWNIGKNQNWLDLSQESGTTSTTPSEITISVDRSGLTPETYHDQLNFTSNAGNTAINIEMKIPSNPVLEVGTDSLDFGTSLTQLNFTITNSGNGDLNWNITDNQEWISTNLSSGTNTSTINVSVDRAELNYGNHSGEINITSNGGTEKVIIEMIYPAVNTAPTAVFTLAPATGTTATNFTFNASSCSDNEDPSSALQVRWDFDGNGSWDTNYSTTKTVTHVYPTAGNYSVKLEVKDTGGLTDTDVKNVFIYSVEMVQVDGGTFWMGSNDGELNEQPIHKVTLSSFFIGKYEITQEEYQEIMGNNPSVYSGNQNPVENVSWFDAVEFCNRLSVQQGLTPCYSGSDSNTTCDFSVNGYRLPTEAEWEYAAKGGNQSQGYIYSGSNVIEDIAWYRENSGNATHPIGEKLGNEQDIYDMTGNVLEWCNDWYGAYSEIDQVDPIGLTNGDHRVFRGGSFYARALYCRSALRIWGHPSFTSHNIGFRVVLAQ